LSYFFLKCGVYFLIKCCIYGKKTKRNKHGNKQHKYKKYISQENRTCEIKCGRRIDDAILGKHRRYAARLRNGRPSPFLAGRRLPQGSRLDPWRVAGSTHGRNGRSVVISTRGVNTEADDGAYRSVDFTPLKNPKRKV
jgi:hypothetical protein